MVRFLIKRRENFTLPETLKQCWNTLEGGRRLKSVAKIEVLLWVPVCHTLPDHDSPLSTVYNGLVGYCS